MNVSEHSHAFRHPSLNLEQLAHKVPAAFSDHAAETTSGNYVFISTKELVTALLDAGFAATQARQSGARKGNPAYVRHMLRFQHTRESVTLVDAIPQIALINSHDGKCSYQLRAGLYRPICTNGMLTRLGDFGLIHVPHRGNVVQNVVDGALALMRDFSRVGAVIERMAALQLTQEQRVQYANAALLVRYVRGAHQPITPEQVLVPRRSADSGNDLWRVFNVVQENVMRGGLAGRSANGRAVQSHAINAIREDVRINNELWQLATALLRD
jgi:Domain of unknown function (DUF932)